MSKNSAAALALASLCACAGSYTNGSTPINPIDGGGSGGSTDGGSDAGADGGVDGGADAGPDAGCVAVSLNGLNAVDNCLGAQVATASLSIADPNHGCTVNITLDNGDGPCTGVASGGTANAFDGGADAGPDAGCAPLTLNGLAVRDACAGSAQLPQNGFANISVSDAGTCQADITLDTSSTPCTGTASGGSVDSFSGTCAAMQCASTSLPGTIFCSSSSGLCQIQICAADAGTCP